jgi:hypothetical protein
MSIEERNKYNRAIPGLYGKNLLVCCSMRCGFNTVEET